MTATVRLAGPADAPTVAGLMAEFRDWQGRSEPVADDLRRSVERLIDDPDTEYLLAACGEDASPEGVCQLRFRYGLWYSANDCWLEDLFVRESARGTGLGAQLVEAALERARARGCRRVDLDAASDNTAALRLYERYGFTSETLTGATLLLLRLRLQDL